MQRVEERLEIVPPEKTKDEVVNVLPTAQLLVWVEQLFSPQLCQPAFTTCGRVAFPAFSNFKNLLSQSGHFARLYIGYT